MLICIRNDGAKHRDKNHEFANYYLIGNLLEHKI
ncbi:alternative oxidase [Vibrio sp. THAF190c]|nr:alternative oxidase [Vibrio sp. THAF190c]